MVLMYKKYFLLTIILFPVLLIAQNKYPFQNPSLPLDVRVNDLISRLTLHEKIGLMQNQSPGVPRLNIPEYDWWNEALHGVARTNENVTVFPQAIGMAASFDKEGVYKAADIVSTEGRAIFNESIKNNGGTKRYYGITYWTPNVNIFRDPRWGRGQETFGEDPFLTSKIGSAVVRGLQGHHPFYLKSAACAKHFVAHSGPEATRHSFDSHTTLYDLWDTYLPAFRELVVKADVQGVMCAYNRLNGVPCCGNSMIMTDILRKQWHFKGYTTSDCGAINDFANGHNTHSDDVSAVSDAVLAGTDLDCGNLYSLLEKGVEYGLITEKDINVSLSNLLRVLFRIGMFDPYEVNPYSDLNKSVLECEEHKQHAYKMAKESMVLLKNENNILPLDCNKIHNIAIIGPNADNPKTLLGNYNGVPSEIITPYMSLKSRFGDRIKINYIKGVGIVDKLDDAKSFKEIAKETSKSDVIIFVGGISADYEGEAGDAGAGGYYGFSSGDRSTMKLPSVQTELLKELKKTNKPIILVNMSGSVMNFEWEKDHVDAILQAWYGGQYAGHAIVDVLFGEYNPSGRMPLTTYQKDSDLPPFEDYSMENRTYRYFKGKPLYPFGYGLSYTTFEYGDISMAKEVHTGDSIRLSVKVKNIGKKDGDEVVQLYVIHPQVAGKIIPISSLKGFERVNLRAGEEKLVDFILGPEELALTDENGNLIESKGSVSIYIGGGQYKYSEGSVAMLNIIGDDYMVY